LSKPASGKIEWLEWGAEAFEKAACEKKPILLAISAVWCHWCHVQDRNTYSDPAVIQLVNRYYVPIRVDTDKRPDINRRYNMGGWPTAAFLTPEGSVVAGGTYMPPDQMKEILQTVRERYLHVKSESATLLAEQVESPATIEVSHAIIDDILGYVVASFDPLYGGFGDEPKFPQTDSLELALTQYWYTGDKGLLTVVTKTLDRMGEGGIYDRHEGGFFRYSTTRDWKVPHYEKMCEDNARLLSIYLHAYQATRRDAYRKLAGEIAQYVNLTLSDQKMGGFYGSQDADESYYKLQKSERASADRPYVDRTIYTNWNGLMARAYLEAAPLLADDTLTKFALKTIDRLVNQLYDEQKEVMYHYLSGGTPQLRGLLADQLTFADALLHAYQTTADAKYLEHAEALVRHLDQQLLDTKNGGYYDSAPNPNSPGYLKLPQKPLDENSYASMLLTKLHHATGEEAYLQKAKFTLESLAGEYTRYGIMASAYALAVDLFLDEPTRIVIVGSRKERLTTELLEASLRAYDPRRLIVPLDPDTDGERMSRLGYSAQREPRAYVCVGKTCLEPTTVPAEILRQLSKVVDARRR